MPTKFIAAGWCRPASLETTTDSEAHSEARPRSANETQPNAIDPGWKKIRTEPAMATSAPEKRATAHALHAVGDGEQQCKQRPDGQHDCRHARGYLLHRPVQAAVSPAESKQPVRPDEHQGPPTRERKPQRRAEEAKDRCRQRKAESRAPERVKLAVREPDRDEVRATNEDGADKSRERRPVDRGIRRNGSRVRLGHDVDWGLHRGSIGSVAPSALRECACARDTSASVWQSLRREVRGPGRSCRRRSHGRLPRGSRPRRCRARARHRHRPDRAAARASAAFPCTGSICREAMVAQLRAKPGAEQIGVTIGDFATTTVESSSRSPTSSQHDHEPDHAGRAGRRASGTPQRISNPADIS